MLYCSISQYPEFFSFGVMSRKGPSEEARANTFACFRFKGEGWSHEVAEKFDDKTCIIESVNKRMLTEVIVTNFDLWFMESIVFCN